MGFFSKKEKLPEKIEWLIAGLGNPGKKYINTRHNIGWMAASKLCEKYKKPLMPFSNIYLASSINIENKTVLIVLPTTFMNNSGEAVKSVIDIYDIPIQKIIIVVDEYNFPLGKVHLRTKGGDGGHNGVASIIEHLESNEFLSLRCGIGKNFPQGGMIDYVLSDFSSDELKARDEMLIKAVESIECVICEGKARGMSLVNSGQLWAEEV